MNKKKMWNNHVLHQVCRAADTTVWVAMTVVCYGRTVSLCRPTTAMSWPRREPLLHCPAASPPHCVMA